MANRNQTKLIERQQNTFANCFMDWRDQWAQVTIDTTNQGQTIS
ncbi:hypothetical protein [Vibrio sp. D173a]|nr:hypothetical protein [Vibrio sp. D173a]